MVGRLTPSNAVQAVAGATATVDIICRPGKSRARAGVTTMERNRVSRKTIFNTFDLVFILFIPRCLMADMTNHPQEEGEEPEGCR